MKSKKLIVAVFAAVALLFSFGVAVEKASADSILFPWIIKSTTVTTMVSVVNTAETTSSCSGSPQLHYEYFFKNSTANGKTESCGVSSFSRDTSTLDLVSFDASGLISAGGALFNDNPGINGNVTYTPNNFSLLSAAAPRRSFLIVDNNFPNCFDGMFRASLYGEALIIQLSQGAAWGYVAYNGSRGQQTPPTPLLYSDVNDMQGEVLRSPRANDSTVSDVEFTPVVIYPLTTFKTKFFVTPANWKIGQRTGVANSRIQLCLDPEANNTAPNADGLATDPTCIHSGIYDNDEGELDGNTPVNVVCTAGFDIDEDPSLGNTILTQSQIDYLKIAGGSAWTYVRSMHGSFTPTPGIPPSATNISSDSIVGKLDYTEAPITIGSSSSIPGAINNFTWIRNSKSLESFSLDHGINEIDIFRP